MRFGSYRTRAACVLLAFATATGAKQPQRELPQPADQSGVATFNRAFTDAIRTMNNDAVLSLWEEDGIALLPDTKAVRGKAAMRTMLDGISSAHPKAKMEHFTNQCFDIVGSATWVSEWCLEHQVVSEPGKPTFNSWGKLLLVLHRQASGEWRLAREMWNQASSSELPSTHGALH